MQTTRNTHELSGGPTPSPPVGRAEQRIATSPAMRLLDRYLAGAASMGASDLHLAPGEASLSVRARVDGILRELEAPPVALADAMLTRLRLLAAVDLSERRQPQDGRFSFHVEGRRIDVRAAFLPVHGGERITLRFAEDAARSLSLDELSLPRRLHERLTRALAGAGGLIVVAGPTGSGKTTTLYACLQAVNRPELSIVTVEDPVERRLAGIAQVQVDEDCERTFAASLRAILRQDPDVIMIGEMRDADSARIACRAALTGHLVLTTVHASDAGEVVPRLRDMGVPEYLLRATLSVSLAQRLVRRVCVECKKLTATSEYARALFRASALEVPHEVAEPDGCSSCAGTGYRGRIAVFDGTGARTSDAPRAGAAALLAAGLSRVASLETTVAEVMARCPDSR
jgi:type II secretory ATPase GspE/PulE/Tfp pilus assembly ATPase PilB-like protein